MGEKSTLEKARMKVVTEMKRHELNKAIRDGKDIETVKAISDEIMAMAQNKFELEDLLDPVGYNNYKRYVERE